MLTFGCLGEPVNETDKLAAEQLANIEIIKFMILDLWGLYLLEQNDPAAKALSHRERHIHRLQAALDAIPDSTIRCALLDSAEQNWQQILGRLRTDGVTV